MHFGICVREWKPICQKGVVSILLELILAFVWFCSSSNQNRGIKPFHNKSLVSQLQEITADYALGCENEVTNMEPNTSLLKKIQRKRLLLLETLS